MSLPCRKDGKMRPAMFAVVLTIAFGAAGAAPQRAPVQVAAPRSSVLEALLAGRDAHPAVVDAVKEGRRPPGGALDEPTRAIGGYVQKLRSLSVALEAASRTTTIDAARRGVERWRAGSAAASSTTPENFLD